MYTAMFVYLENISIKKIFVKIHRHEEGVWADLYISTFFVLTKK